MKNLILIILIAITSVSYTPTVLAANEAQSFCQYVSADDKKRLRSFLKTNKIKIRKVFNSIQCNGQNLLKFASSRSATKTGALMINKLPKKTVKKLMASITHAELAAIASKRVNG